MSDLIAPFTSWSGLSTEYQRDTVWGDNEGGLIVQTASSGFEARLQTWSYPKYRYTFTVNSMRNFFESGPSARNFLLQVFTGFFNQLGGGFDSCLLNDNKTPDNKVTGQFIATADGVKTQFQLQRTMGGHAQPVFTPSVTSTDPAYIVPVAYNNGSPVGGATFDAHTGILTYPSPPAAGHTLTADFAYFWRLRFENNSISVSTAQALPQYWESKQFKMLTTRV